MDCVCGVRQTGADEDELFLAVRRHSDEAHPEVGVLDEAIRALIAVQATMTPWDGTRVALNRRVEVVPMTPGHAQDVLAFFDKDAFADNPIWAGCFCFYPHFEGDLPAWQKRTASENRAAKSELILRGEAHALLAYANGKMVGWCNAAPRRTLPMFDRQPRFAADDAGRVGSIVCFNVAAPYRGQGIARALLNAACAYLRDQGFEIAEAYPPKDAVSAARAHLGTVPMFLAAGFSPHTDVDNTIVMRRTL
jgi:GNAT superfamily N-acetyltransferase